MQISDIHLLHIIKLLPFYNYVIYVVTLELVEEILYLILILITFDYFPLEYFVVVHAPDNYEILIGAESLEPILHIAE